MQTSEIITRLDRIIELLEQLIAQGEPEIKADADEDVLPIPDYRDRLEAMFPGWKQGKRPSGAIGFESFTKYADRILMRTNHDHTNSP